MNQNDPLVKNYTQYQSSKYFPDNSIDLEGKSLMSSFDNKLLKEVTLKSTTTRYCSTSNFVKSNSYLKSLSINNDNTSDNFSINKFEKDVTSVEN